MKGAVVATVVGVAKVLRYFIVTSALSWQNYARMCLLASRMPVTAEFQIFSQRYLAGSEFTFPYISHFSMFLSTSSTPHNHHISRTTIFSSNNSNNSSGVLV